MNNKIIARIVATVMAIAMLGSLSFAASLSGDTLNLAGVTDVDYAGNTMKTVIAFYADASNAEAPADAADIIAINQVNSGDIPTSYVIDTTKTAKDWVVVRYGGDADQTATASFAVPQTSTAIITPAATYEIGGVTYTEVAYFENTVNPGAGKKVENYGFNIKNTNGTKQEFINFPGATTISGEGTWTYGVLIVGVDGNAAWEANAYHTVVAE